MTLRISSGTFKNKKLKSIPGKEFRPISDRIKLALFSIIRERIKNKSFLDLFAGTGSVGFEALSNGAANVTFVELQKKKIELININSAHLDVSDHIEIIKADVFKFYSNKKYDIIFAGPPYKMDLTADILSVVKDHDLLLPDGLLIVQHHFKEKVDHVDYNIMNTRRYGLSILDFFRPVY